MYLREMTFFMLRVPFARYVTRDINLPRCHFTLGFIVNLKKSALIPSQVMLHLGVMIDTARWILFLSSAKLKMILYAAQE